MSKLTFKTVDSVGIGVAVAVLAIGVWTILHEINQAMKRGRDEKSQR